MKKVILEEKKSAIYLDDLRVTDIIGMQTIGGNKFMLSRKNNGFEFIGHSNISSKEKIYYKFFIDALDIAYSLFVFESKKELFKWMSE